MTSDLIPAIGQDLAKWNDTTGNWATEAESAAGFDSAAEQTECFTISREVEGYYLQPRMLASEKTPRIDRILSPTNKLLNLGWAHGPVGVEIKASGVNVGPPLCQLADYSRAAFEIKTGYHIVLEWVYLWPWSGAGGPLASFYAQHRIGSAFPNRPGFLVLHMNCTNMFTGNPSSILIRNLTTGRKAGSR